MNSDDRLISVRTCVAPLAPVLAWMLFCNANADYVYVDKGVELTVSSQAAQTPGYTLFNFFLNPSTGNIGSINADFNATATTGDALKQIYGPNNEITLFRDEYGLYGGGGDDSHLAFDRNGVDGVIDLTIFDNDTTTDVHAFFGFQSGKEIISNTELAQIVLQNGLTGNAVISLGLNVDNTVDTAAFDVDFSVTAVPEPSSLVLLGMGAGAVIVAHRRKRRHQHVPGRDAEYGDGGSEG